MELATKNSQAMIGWPKFFRSYNGYNIENSKLDLTGDKMEVNEDQLLKLTIQKSLESKPQSGGAKEIKNFRIKSENMDGGFKKLESMVDDYFRKNNLDTKNKTFLLSLKSLDDQKIYIKKYRKKNL